MIHVPGIRPAARRERRLHSLETRLASLEGELASVLAGEARPAHARRAELWSRWLLLAGGVFVVAAIALAIF